MLKSVVNTVGLADQAVQNFRTSLADRVERLSMHCWGSNVNTQLGVINTLITSVNAITAPHRQQFEAVEPFDDEEIKQLTVILAPLRELNMADKVREFLVAALTEKGFDPEIFKAKAHQR
ncbi:MAG: hypothetical protein A3C85_03260 [Candidatus Doudnabacteria bacterium RIFCSPHIGHO2_02_FULL_48_21]|uniref:Uncharacterized protein n=1 Tax=Candidatus Doudnabacteria bacterium RIFCSPLOWO2_02_FULL_48_13 TaxID=1817845 RepID=A0A1F5QAW2_9BACT|nr:MAG: hypothetical protein A3K05_03860 [Candidatus Doudnabacteria bacterium RIFCSPHIGHO2_01_48_18]OGE77206.1 MAG: hypothetical protein A2668_01760 [Candidatus Doudnabacteria bacterium RIFCSPHIGHO2_01_FULL_48_180]OGE91416.1 MAG: hypothetical protein A3F44_00660 [Candidatus Doudnabacteria bacterium RIFCSPHIGHO2_12_FULL_47_25]OGE93264.1 MAG: hypothetical protein A3C85_03260 [Candidatus Doudnabacteria bacterium RIFCSPHIGHO2_02_FULL_48_21]OGE96795.1 MAG: hypothetical protein A3A83_01995 [Candidatu